jgi:ferredoxin-thioredoxin reductase catalytic subunit
MDNPTNQEKELKEKLQEHANEKDIFLNKNLNTLNGVIKGLLKNKGKHGDIFCPCRIDKIQENICPCIHHLNEIKNQGRCACNLFTKKA